LVIQNRATRLQIEGVTDSLPRESATRVVFEAFVAAERVPAVLAMFPAATLMPLIEAPCGVRTEWNEVDARIAAVRGLMEVSGPLTARVVSQRTGITERQAAGSLEALEGEGFVLRGKFCEHRAGRDKSSVSHTESLGGNVSEAEITLEWCHRRLLARIHRLTMDGLRRQIQPVNPEVFMRFLTGHHGLTGRNRRAGPDGLFEVISLLQGLDLAASTWEESILPGRVQGYRPEWLDELCLTGEVGWGRLFPPRKTRESPALLSKIVPVSIFLRSDVDWLRALRGTLLHETAAFRELPRSRMLTADSETAQSFRPPAAVPPQDGDGISSAALRVLNALSAGGALFASDLMSHCGLARAELNQALGELIALGLVTADGFGGLRDLAGGRRKQRSGVVLKPGLIRQRHSTGGTGRWSLSFPGCVSADGQDSRDRTSRVIRPMDEVPQSDSGRGGGESDTGPQDDPVEQWAWQLLRRWGVVFRDLLHRESGTPRWWELLQVYRRLEARGEIRGGRFISGVAGEQFGLGETVRKLRQIRDAASRPSTRTRRLRHSFLDAMRSSETTSADVPKKTAGSSYDEQARVVALPGGVVEEVTPLDQEHTSGLLVLSAADPLNLIGIVTDHARVPSAAHNRIVLLDGSPVAALQNGEIVMLADLPVAQYDELQRLLDRNTVSTSVVSQVQPEESSVETADTHSEQVDAPSGERQRIRPVIS
ncbi:MAG: hypothetical protein VB858_06010, partial [Planctomycetaceae bacterium]